MEISSSDDDPEVVHEKLRKKKIPLIVPTDEELNYRKENYADFNVHREKIQCTSCAKNLKSFVSLKQSLAVHPTLSVLQCKTCSKFYGDGTFSVDEDGSDQYCRWCGEGGALYLCSNCSCTFCRPCIKRNFARSTLEEVEDDDWKCFICNPKPLWSHRAVCAAVIKFIAEKSQSKKTKGEPSNTKRKRRVSSTSSDSDDKNQKKRTKKRKKADVSSDNDSEWEEPTSRKKESSGSLTKKKQESKAALDTSDSEKESRSRRASSRKRVQGSKAALDTSDSEKESRLRKVSSSKKVQESKAALDTSDSEKGRRLRKASSSKKVQESKAALVTSDSEKGSRLRKASSNKKVQESKAALDTSDSEKESRLRKASSVSRSKKEQEKKAALDTNDTGKVSRSRKASSVSRIKKGQENKAALDTSDSEKESRLRKASSSKKVQESKAALDSSDSEKGRKSRKKISSTHKIRLEKDEFRRSNNKEGILSPNSSTHEDGDAVATPPFRSSHEGKKKSKMNYSEEEDLVIELNEHTSESLAEIFKDHLQDIVQAGEGLVEFGRHILNEEITVKNLSKPRKRIKLRNKLDNLCTLSCSNVKQANENFIISYHRFIRGLTSKEGINTDLNKQPNENEESASKSDEEMQVNNEDGKDEELKVSSKDNTESSDKSGEKREGKDDNTEVSKSDESMEVNDEDNTENISMSNESQNENDGKEESPKMKNRSQDDDSSGEERETKSERTLKGEKQGKYNKSENKKKKVQEKDAPEVESMETLDEKNESSGTVDSVVDDIRSEMTEKEGSEQDAEPETETAVEVRSTVAAEEGIEAELGGVEDREEEIQDEVEKAGNNKNEKESSGKSQNISNAGGESLKHNSDEGNTDICSDVNMCGDSQDTDAIEKSQDTDTSSDEPLGNVSEVDKELDATSDLVDGNIDKCSKTDKQVNVDCESLDVSTIPEVQTNNSPQNSPCNMSDANSCSDMWSDGECGGNNTHIMSVIGVLDESLGNISEEEFQMSRNEKQSCVNSHVDASLKSKKKIENDDSELAANKTDNKHEETNETVSEECGSDRPTHETKPESPEAESSDQTECLLNKKNKISISADISSVQCLNEEVEKNYEENSDKIPRDDRDKDNEGTDEDLNASQALDDLNIEEPEDKNKNNEGTDDNDDLNASQALDELKVEKPKDKNKEALKALLASSSEDERRQSHRKRKKHEPKENDKEMNGKESTPSGNVKGVKPTRKSSLSSLSYVSSDSESEDRVVGGLGKDSRVGAFNVKDLEEYKRDEKLRVECKIELKKLPQDVSQKHHGALSSSDDESNEKQIKKLLNMKTLKQCPKRNNSSSESESESEIQKNNKTNKKTLKKEKRKSLTLEDFCNLSDDNSHSSEKSNDENRMEKVLQNMLDNLNNKRNKVAEETLLMSSCSDSDGEEGDQKNDKKKKTDSPKKEIKREKNDSSVENSEKNSKEKSNSDKESTDEEARKKKNWRRDKLLRMKLSETDTSEEDRKWKAKQEKKKDKIEKDSDSDGLHGPKRKSRKKTVCRGFLDSDSDVIGISSSESDSDDFKMITKKKRRRESDSNSSSKQKVKSSDSSDSERAKKKKVKRRRIRKPISDSDDSDSCKEINESQKSETTPTKGRKNIRRVMKDDYVAEETRRAAKEEEERRKRIAEKQKFYNEVFEVKKHDGTRTITDIILDFDKETKEILVEVDRKLVPKLKPHQEEGIRFMWNSCFESLKQIERTEGSGCILAHCMGLGKTFQVVTLVHTLMNNEKTKVRSVLIVCPLSTVLNWVNEFNKWLEELPHDIDVFDITKYKQVYERVGVLRQWHENGGVMVLSYEMFRNLCNPNAKRLKKRAIEAYQTALIDPGADLVVCDEGHLLKNDTTAISIAMRRIKTQRRIVLTGTPLQNNLQEYHCMVQFVKPSLLGTRKEFLNRFVNPINNGQYENSTAYDVKVMKRRAHVLHRMLEGCVQRFDYSVLTPFLPPKFEFAVSIRLTDLQIKLYKHYLEYFARGRDVGDGLSHNKTATMFKDYHVLQRVWTHPRVLLMNAEKEEEKKLREESDSEGSLRDFIADSEETSASSIKSSSGSESDKESDKNDKGEVINKWKSSSRNGSERKEGDDNASVKSVEIEEVKEKHPGDPRDWWRQFITDDSLLDDIRQSGKLSLLFALLNECEKLGDKVLVFSQSLNSLNLIEYFLAKIDEANQNNKPDEKLGGYLGTWSLGLDYFRMDGSSTGENRSAWCKNFNREDNHRARLFLISTKAGGLGINLFAANRVIIFDASWNPSHDLQSIFRVYRFGQKKPCYIYRFLAQSTMEERIYSRQVSKLSLACRVVDEQQIERHYSMADLQELYIFNPEENKPKSTPAFPKDRLLADLLKGSSTWIESYHEHDSLLENKEDEELNEEERKAAWDEYEKEKKGITDNVIDPAQQYAQLVEELRRKQPELSEEQVHQQATVTYQKLFDYMRINAELARRQQQQQQQQLRNYQAQLAQQQKLQLLQQHVPQQLQQHVPQQLQQYVPQQLQQYVPQRLQQYMAQQMQRPQGNQLPPVHLQQPQVNQNNKSLESVAVQQKEAAAQRSSAGPHTSAVGGSSGGGQHRIKVKSFGLISNSNFSANSGSNQQAPNPFSAAFQARASNSGVQSPRIISAAGSSGGQTVIKSTDVVEVE